MALVAIAFQTVMRDAGRFADSQDQGIFETRAKVVYYDARFRMGLAFTEMRPDQRSIPEAWLAEIVIQLRPGVVAAQTD